MKRPQGRAVLLRVVDAAQRAFVTAKKRYIHGVASYLDVLDAQRELFNAKVALTRTQLENLVAVVQLYKTLGGGWTP
jgi:outer membrane protein TolC